MSFQDEVTRFYRRWHALERALGPEGGLVLDFDMASDVGPCPPFANRNEALRALEDFRVPQDLRNPAFVEAKLEGAAAYLRALDGERADFDVYVRQTMGITPEVVPRAELDALREELEVGFADRRIPFSPDGRVAFGAWFGSVSGDQLGTPLRAHAERYVARVLALLGGLPTPEYRIEVVREDAYWSNWIDGSAASGVLLRVNTHERIEYNRFSAEALAAHEIAGHAVHVAALRRAVAGGSADPCVLNLAVHSCEAFHMEGLAQVAQAVLSNAEEGGADHALLERHRDYAGARINNAQIAIERGADLDEEVAATLRDCPLLKPLAVQSSLRDRRMSPLLRSYIHVYAPSRRLFLQAVALPEASRAAFFRAAWTGVYTPDQLRNLVSAV